MSMIATTIAAIVMVNTLHGNFQKLTLRLGPKQTKKCLMIKDKVNANYGAHQIK